MSPTATKNEETHLIDKNKERRNIANHEGDKEKPNFQMATMAKER